MIDEDEDGGGLFYDSILIGYCCFDHRCDGIVYFGL